MFCATSNALRRSLGHVKTTKKPSENDAGRRAYSVEEAAVDLGIGRSLMYDLVKRGEVRTVKLGRRRVVPAVELDRLMSEAQ